MAERNLVLNTFLMSTIVFRAQITPNFYYWVKIYEKDCFGFLVSGQKMLDTIKREAICFVKSRGGLGLTVEIEN